jgi:CBS-domain-containing membrane protein
MKRGLKMPYIAKMKGRTQSPPRVNLTEIMWSWIGSFLGIAAVAVAHYKVLDRQGLVMMIGSFGASAVLIYGAVRSPLAQPRNLMGGHVLSALVGVTAWRLFGGHEWLAASLAVSVSIALMHLTKTLHPPGGATALIAVIGGGQIHSLGYWYALMPVGLGAGLMLLIALLVNNIPKNRSYPEFWL